MIGDAQPLKVNRYRIDAVDRALVLMNVLASMPGVSASELATALNINRSLVFRMLTTLVDRDYVTKDSGNLYSLGPQFIQLALKPGGDNVWSLAIPDILDDLLNETQESIGVIARENLEGVRVGSRESPQLLRFHMGSTGERGPLYRGGATKVLLAFSTLDLIEEVIEEADGNFSPSSLKTKKEILGFLGKIRDDGYYVSVGDAGADVFSVSAPILSAQLGAIGALAVLGPTSRLDDDRQAWLVKRVVDAAAQISKRLR